MFVVGNVTLDLVFDGSIENTIRWISDFKGYYLYIVLFVITEMYLWPSAPPMIFDRVNRRVVFQVFFRTKIIAWDDCVASIQHFVQASTAHASQGYNLRIEGNVINGKPGQKTQRATALIHQSGISEDLLNYWEYIRHYMEGGPDAVPKPLKLHKKNPFGAAWYAFMRNYPGLAFAKLSWIDFKQPNRSILKKMMDLFIVFTAPLVMFISLPLVVPMFSMAFLAAKLGRVRRYPKETMQLCKEGHALAKAKVKKTTQRKPVIRVNGKLIDSD
jgi:hypothetical protein